MKDLRDLKDLSLQGDALAPNQCAKKNVLKNVLPDLKSDAGCIVGWQVRRICCKTFGEDLRSRQIGETRSFLALPPWI
jgi:hypothetical protein